VQWHSSSVSTLLPVIAANSVQTLQDVVTNTHTALPNPPEACTGRGVWRAFVDRNSCPRMPLVPTAARLKRVGA
jgi:hypothetical protein